MDKVFTTIYTLNNAALLLLERSQGEHAIELLKAAVDLMRQIVSWEEQREANREAIPLPDCETQLIQLAAIIPLEEVDINLSCFQDVQNDLYIASPVPISVRQRDGQYQTVSDAVPIYINHFCFDRETSSDSAILFHNLSLAFLSQSSTNEQYLQVSRRVSDISRELIHGILRSMTPDFYFLQKNFISVVTLILKYMVFLHSSMGTNESLTNEIMEELIEIELVQLCNSIGTTQCAPAA